MSTEPLEFILSFGGYRSFFNGNPVTSSEPFQGPIASPNRCHPPQLRALGPFVAEE